jgi:GT2 family glycosyltransferase
MVTLALGIPTINRKDIFQPFLDRYQEIWRNRHMFIIDNGNQGLDFKNGYRHNLNLMPYNLGVSGSWNLIMRTHNLKSYTHSLILNDDVFFSKSPNEIIQYIEQNPADIYLGTKSWSVFVLPYDTYYKVGPFDEEFRIAYYEDNDYEYRVRLKKLNIHRSEFFDPEIFNNSMSIKADRSLNQNFEFNKQRYIDKWGGLPGNEQYTSPFNISFRK